jgi:hypothetical protein
VAILRTDRTAAVVQTVMKLQWLHDQNGSFLSRTDQIEVQNLPVFAKPLLPYNTRTEVGIPPSPPGSSIENGDRRAMALHS